MKIVHEKNALVMTVGEPLTVQEISPADLDKGTEIELDGQECKVGDFIIKQEGNDLYIILSPEEWYQIADLFVVAEPENPVKFTSR